MYIRDCGYGRSKRSRVRRRCVIIVICVLTLGMGGVTVRAMSRQMMESNLHKATIGMNYDTVTEEILPIAVNVSTLETEMAQNVVKEENPIAMAETLNMSCETADDRILVVIDPGHGGEDEGCSRDIAEEKSINLQISLSLRDQLIQMGYDALLTREDDSEITLEERVKIANDANADIYISIHQNSCNVSSVSGVETWYNPFTLDGKESKRLAQLIHSDVLLYTEESDRGLWEDDSLHVIRETHMPSCLIETGFLSNAEDRELLLDAEYQNEIVEGIASGIDLYFHPKTMYLTFDDGPSPENTEKILDILKENNIKAAFFVIGENVRKNPEIARRIVEEGHTVGIHCNWHDYDALYADVNSYVEDFEQAYQTVYEVTGVKATMFRFPGGSINSYNKGVYKDIVEEMTNRGYVYYDWNASLEDAVSKADPEQLIRNAKESTLGRKKIIMLAHDTVDNTVLCLQKLIEQLPEYQMEQLTDEVEPIQF